MATSARKLHYFVINQAGQSAHRHGPFESVEAAREWASRHYSAFPAWITAAEPVTPGCKPLDKEGIPVKG